MKRTAFKDLGKDALPRHDAVTDGLVNGTVLMAFLTDLRQFQEDRAALQARPYGQAGKIDTPDDHIFTKGTGAYVGAAGPEGFDLFAGQEAYLAVPMAGVGVAFDAPVRHEGSGCDLFLLRTSVGTDT